MVLLLQRVVEDVTLRRLFVLCLLAAVVLTFAGSQVQAQETALQYQSKLNGQPIALERGTIAESGKIVTYLSEATQTSPQAVTLTSTLTVSADTRRPLSYNVAVQFPGGRQKVSVMFDGNKAAYRAELPTGIQSGEMRLHDGFVVCENNIWTQFSCLIQAFYGAGGNQKLFYVFVPMILREISVRIEDRGLEKIGAEEAEQITRHLTVQYDTTPTIEVWAEPETGLPVQVRIESQKVEAARIWVTP